MSDVIDTTVVKLGFDNNEFINNVNMSIMAVDALKDSLVFDSKSFDSLSKAANNIDLSNISAGVEALSQRFSTFGIVGMTAIQRITNAAIDLGSKFAGLLAKPWKQILTGGWSRASNIGQAKFQLEGLFGKTEEGVAKLNMTMMATGEQVAMLAQQAQGYSEDMIVAMNAADYAVADTAYGLDSAAKAASVLATSGVDVLHFSEDLKDSNGLMRTEMQVALRSISGVAAMANRGYDDVARIFERVSGAGRVMGDDLNSLASFGLNAAATLRDYLNEIGVTANATEKDIRDMVSKGEIDFMTFAQAMDNAYGDHAKDANNTFSGAFSNMKFALSKIGADFISPIRNKMVPLFNDVRIAINQVRKALNFKMKFPGLEEEISLVELFTRIITNLSNKAHELFMEWHGGQNVMEQAMAGFANFSGESIERVKAIFDGVTNGSKTAKQGITELMDLARLKGIDLTDVYKSLGETFEKTEDQIEQMCKNGEISFEDFYAAMNNVFGSNIQDTRISQLAQLIHNVTQGFWNLARTVSSIIGPVFYAFFQVFNLGGMKGIVGITEAFANFTKTLVASRETQEKIRSLAFNIFTILKSGISIVKKLAKAVFQIIQALAPLFIQVIEFADVIASVVSYIVDIIVESNLLSSVISVLARAFQVAAYVIVNVLRIILAIIGPAIRGIGEVFAFLARTIASVDVSFIGVIIDAFENLISTVLNGGLMNTLINAVGVFFAAIGRLFKGLTLSFAIVSKTITNVAERIATIFDRIVTSIRNSTGTIGEIFNKFVEYIKELWENPRKLIALIGQMTSLTVLMRFAQTMRGIGRTFSGLGNYLNSNAILAFVNAIKVLARAVLEFSIGIVLLSSIPQEQLWTTIKLIAAMTISVAVFLKMYFTYMEHITKINNSVVADPMIKFMNKLNSSINAFLQSIGRATNIAAIAVLLLSAAASLAFFFKAVNQFSSLDTAKFETGLKRVAMVVGLIAAFLAVLLHASGIHLHGDVLKDNIIFGSTGLMGAAMVMLSLIIVLKAFEDVIVEYSKLHMSKSCDQFKAALVKIASSLAVIIGAVAILGLTSKSAGFGLIGSVTAMMGILTALEGFCSIIVKFAALTKVLSSNFSSGQIAAAIGMLIGAVVILVFGLVAITEALTEGSSVFKASLKSGIEFKSNSSKFFGIVLTILSMCLFLQMFALAVNTMDPANIGNAGIMLGVIAVLLGALAGVVALAKNVPTGNILGFAAILFVLSAVLPLLSAFEWTDLIAGAVSLTLVIAALSAMMLALNAVKEATFKSGLGTITYMFLTLSMLIVTFGMLSGIEPDKLNAVGISLASVIATFAVLFGVLSFKTFTFNAGAILTMVSMLAVLSVALAGLTHIPDFNPEKMKSIVAAISALALVMSLATRIMSGTIIVDGLGLIMALIGIAGALSILMIALVEASNHLEGDGSSIRTIAQSINWLIPIIAVVSGLSMALSNAGSWKGVGMMGALLAIIGVFALIFAEVAKIGDVRNTVSLMRGLADAVIGLSMFVGVLASLTAVMGLVGTAGGGIGAIGIVIGLVGMAAIISTIGGFLWAVAQIAQIGDIRNTTTLLNNMGTFLDALVPFLLKMAAMCAVVGIVSPLVLAGAVGFGAILAVVSGFAYMMAIIANIGNPTSTIGIINTLTEAFSELTKTFAILALLGIAAPLILTSLMLLVSAMGLMLTLSFVIGQIDIIKSSILSGISTILITATSLVAATEAMSSVDLVAILKFITALGIIALTPMVGITKFALIASTMSIIGVNSSRILKGSRTAFEMINSLEAAASVMHDILRVNTGNLVKASTDILKASYNMSQMIGQYHIAGMIKGLSDPAMLTQLYATAYVAAWVVALAMRNALGIHSPGKEGEYDMDMTFAGMLGSLTNSDNINSLIGAGSNVMSMFGGSMSSMASAYGADAGTQYMESLSQTLWSGLQYVGQGWSDLIAYAGQSGWGGIAAQKWADTHEIAALSGGNTTTTNTIVNDVKFRGNFQSYEEYLAWEEEHPNGDVDNTLSFDYEMPDFGNLDEFIKGITENFNLGSITEGIGDIDSAIGGLDTSAGSASKSVDNLTKKIDDLMDKYENLWEDAKERANKDLFKGVDDQGDDFLDSVEEIMDKFKNIYKEAVEQTNSEDLFAEVNENDESFAPDTLLRNLEDQVNQVNELNTIIGSLSGRIADNGLRAAISQMSVDDLPELRAMYRMDDSQLSKYESMYQKKVQANQNKIQNELTGSLSQLTGQYTDVATYVATDASTNRLLHNLQAQVDQLNEYNSTVASLMVRIKDVNLREAIATMGVDSLDELKALNRMTDSQLDEYIDIYNKKIAAGAVSIKNELSGQLGALLGEPIDIDEFYKQYQAGMVNVENYVKTPESGTRKAGNAAGQEMSAGIGEGLSTTKLDTDAAYESGKEYVMAMARGTSDSEAISFLETSLDGIAYIIVNAFREYYSTDLITTGNNIIGYIIQGLEESKDAGFDECIDGIPQRIIERIDSKKDQFVSVGKNIVNGVRMGMNSPDVLRLVEAAAARVAYTALKTVKEKLKIKSPSRVFMEIGKYLDEGFAIGIKDYSGLVSDEAGIMAEGSLNSVQTAIQQLSGMLDGSIDLNPTITPTLDLSEINARSAALAGMFNGRQIAVQARADEQQAEMLTQLGNVIAEQNAEPRSVTFNQTNNSPKALNPSEIYRQTKNGFSQLVSAFT